MAQDIVMPRLSDSMEEGVVLAWMKSVGDEVALGEELVEIETDKANMVYESDTAGTLLEILADVNDTVEIGKPIARIGEAGEATGGSDNGAAPEEADQPAGEAEAEVESEAAAEVEQSEASPAPAQEEADHRVKASPLARRIAEDEGVDLESVSGTGPDGRIVKADVESAAEHGQTDGAAAPPAEGAVPASAAKGLETAKGETETVELNRLQQTIARRMSQAKATAPHFYLSTDIDMSECFEERAVIKAQASKETLVPSFNDMIVKAAAIALREFPKANGSYQDGNLELHSKVNVGVAVATDDALVVPVVTDADLKSLTEIAEVTRALAARVRDSSITPPELSGGTFTVSNLGMYGITHFDAVINTPQAGILAVGAIEDRPVVRDGQVVAAKMMSVTLSCDHRILYGAEGAEFLARIRAILEQPISLAM